MTTVEDFHREFPTFYKATLGSLQDRQVLSDDAELANRISTQQRALNEAAGSLPAYDIRRYQSSLDELTLLLSTRRAELRPKTKFSFKTRRSEPPKLATSRNPDQTIEVPVVSVLPEPPGSLTIRGGIAQIKRLDSETHPSLLDNYTITIESITNCVIDLSRAESYTSVTLRNLVQCTIKAGSSTSSLFIESCESCQITGEAQQFRIHTCSECEIRYICRAGRPVIEDCTKMKFGNEMVNNAGQRNPTIVDDFSDLSGDGRNWSSMNGFISV